MTVARPYAWLPPNWMKVALSKMGVKETRGKLAHPDIVAFHAATVLRATSDEVPWCSSFVNWVMQQAGFPTARSAAARSWLTFGESLDTPVYGCIVVLARGRNPAQGHVGLYMGSPTSKTIAVLGGNQNDCVCVQDFLASRVLAYRWPHMATRKLRVV